MATTQEEFPRFWRWIRGPGAKMVDATNVRTTGIRRSLKKRRKIKMKIRIRKRIKSKIKIRIRIAEVCNG